MVSINLTDEIGVKWDVFPWVYSYILWLYCVVFGLGAKAADPQTTTHLLHHLRNDCDFWGAFIVKRKRARLLYETAKKVPDKLLVE